MEINHDVNTFILRCDAVLYYCKGGNFCVGVFSRFFAI